MISIRYRRDILSTFQLLSDIELYNRYVFYLKTLKVVDVTTISDISVVECR